MKKYKVCFVGRIGGALGTSYPITENEEAIRSMLWDKYDSMGRVERIELENKRDFIARNRG